MNRPTTRFNTRRHILCASIVSLLTVSGTVQAATLTKANNTDNLNAGTSWTGGAVPGAADIALWDSTVTAANSVLLGADLSLKGISITNPVGAVTIGGGNILTLGTAGIDMSSATQDLTISSGLTLGGGNQVWNVASGRTLTLNTGAFTRSTGATLNLQGSGTVAVSMTGIANTNGIVGPWATVGTGVDTRYATLSGGNLVGYTGATANANWASTMNSGTTNFDVAAASNTTFGASSRVANTVRYLGGTDTVTLGNTNSGSQLVTNGLINAGTGTLNLVNGTGSLTAAGLAAGSTNEIVLVAANAAINVSARVHNGTGGASAVTIVGPNTVTLSGANDFTGGVNLNSGTLLAGNATALGTTAGTFRMNGGTFGTTAALTIANPINVSGTNTIGHASQTGNITLTGALTGNGTLTNFVGTSAASNVFFNGNLSGFTGTFDYTSRAGNDTQFWRVGANNTTVDLSNAAVILRIGDVIDANAANKNFGFTDGISGATLKLGSLSGDGVFQSSYNNAGPNTLEVGNLNTNTTFSGVLAGGNSGTKIDLTKVGTGTLTLTGANLYTGATTISAGTLRLGDGTAGHDGTIAGTSGVTGSSGATLAFNRAGDNSAGYTISGGLGVTKMGAGTQILTGANSFTGPTQINAGTLAFSINTQNLGSSAFTVANGAGLSVKAASAGSTLLTTSTLTLGSGGTTTLTFDFNSLNTTAALISTGAFTVNGTVNISLLNGAALSSGTHALLDYTSLTGSGVFPTGSFALGTRSSGTIVNDIVNTVLNLNVQSDTPKWTGLDSGNWQVGTTGANSNWKLVNGGTATNYIEGDAVLFDDSATGTTTIGISAANVSPSLVTFNNSTKAYTVSSSGGFGIAGSGSLVKNGTGKVTLNTANTYTGGTTLNAGVLVLNNGSAIGTGALTINGGKLDATVPTVLSTNNVQAWSGDFAFDGTADLDLGSGDVTGVGTGTSRTITTTANTLTVGELRAATHGLIKQGDGALVLTSTGASGATDGSRIAGVLNVAAGTVQMNRTGAFGTGSGDLTVGGLTGNGTIINGAGDERWLVVNSAGTNNFTGTLANGDFGGALGFNKQGTGIQTLSGALSYSGTTTVDGGTLVISGANTGFGTNANVNSGTLVLANPSALGMTSLIRPAGNNVSSIVFATDGNDNFYNFTMGTGTVTTIVSDRATAGEGIEHILSTQSGTNGVGGGTINFTSGANVTSGTGRINFTQFGMGSGTGGAVTTLNPTTANVTIGNVLKSNNTAAQTLELGGTSKNNEITGGISNGTATISVTKSGTSIWTLGGTSTYTGATAINGGILNLPGSLSGTAITVASGAILAESSTGVIGGAGSLSVAGTATLAGQNTFTGKTTINGGGVVTVSSLNSVGTPLLSSSLGTPNSVANGTIDMTGAAGNGTLIYTGTGETTDRVINLAAGANAGLSAILDQSGTGLLKFTSNFTAAGAQTHTLVLQGSTTGAGEIAGAIVNNSATNITSLTKRGSGTWTLSGANTYTGPTVVEAGTLITNTAQTGASTVTVADGATFGVKQAASGTTFNASSLTTGTTTGSTLLLDTGALGNPTAPIISATTFNPTAVTLLKVTGSALTIGSNIPLIDYTGTIGGVGFAGLSLALPARTVGNLVDNTADTRVDLNITQFEQIKWKGNVNGNWDADTNGTGTNGTQNWVTTVTNTATKYLQGTGGTDTVNFDDSATGTTNINIATASVNPVAVNFDNSAKNYTISSTGGFGIGGTGALTKSGTGSLTLNTANTYSGGTMLNGGKLNVNNASALGTGTVTINGGTLDNTSGAPVALTANNPLNLNADFAFTGSSDLDLGSGAATIAKAGADRTVTVNGNMLTIGEIKAAAHGLNKQGQGTLAVSSAGTDVNGSVISGTLNVGAGTLQINRTNAAAAVSGDFTAGGFTGTGTVVNGAAAERWLIVNTSGSFDFNGTLDNGFGGGALGFSKQGTGTQTLSGTNLYTGATTVGGGTLVLKGTNSGSGTNANVNSGTLVLANPSALGFTSLIRPAGNNVASIVFATDGGDSDNVYNFTMATGTVTTIVSDRATAGAGIEHKLNTQSGANGVGGGTINFTSGTNVTSGAGRISFAQFGLGSGIAGAVTTLNPTTANVTLGDVLKSNNNVAQTLELGGTSTDNQITGGISNGTATVSVTKSGTSTWTLSGMSFYSGATAINGGTLLVQGSIEGSMNVNVNAGTLGGIGSIASLLTVGDNTGTRDAILAPGTGIGTLSNTAGVNFGSDAVFALEINTSTLTTDLLTSSGAISLGLGVATLNVTDLGTALVKSGQTFTFLTSDSGVSGQFAGLPDGTVFGVGQNAFEINYTPTSVQLLAVPEPTSAAMLFGGVALLGIRRFRRRAA